VERTAAGESVEATWTVANRRNGIEAGDRAYLYRQGMHGRGLVRDRSQTEPSAGDHWRESKGATNYVGVEWIECLPLGDMVTVEERPA
jgi:hypothetical protein